MSSNIVRLLMRSLIIEAALNLNLCDKSLEMFLRDRS